MSLFILKNLRAFPLWVVFCGLPLLRAYASPGELEDLVRRLQHTYEDVNTWQAEFLQSTFVEVLDKEIRKEGVLAVKKPGRLRLEYQNPRGKLYLSNGKYLWVFSPEDNQVETYSRLNKSLPHEALTFLSGLANIQKIFFVSMLPAAKVPESLIQNRNLKLLELTPRNTQSSLVRMILGVDPKSHLLKEMTLFNTSGNKTHYVFREVKLNPLLKDEFFEFKKGG